MRTVELGSLCRPRQWPVISGKDMLDAGNPVFGANGQIGYTSRLTHERETIAVGCRGSCGHVHLVPARSYINGNAMALDDLDEEQVERKYLYRWLRHRGFADVVTGTSQPQIIQSNIRRVNVPLPPIPEQQRIAEVLDKADALRRLRRRSISRLSELGQAIFSDMFGELNNYSKPLKSLGRVVTGSTPPSTSNGMFGGDIPFVTPGDLGSGETSARFVTPAGAKKSRLVAAGSTLVCCIGATLGKMDQAKRESAFNQQINAIEWGEAVRNDFGFYAVRSLRDTIIFRGKGASTTLPILKKSEFEKLEIRVADLPLQDRFAERLAAVRSLHKEGVAGLEEANFLFASLQHRAFRGEL